MWIEEWLQGEANDVYPFAIYNDEEPVGFKSTGEFSNGEIVMRLDFE